ncbi:MAG: UDP-N-acetylmuramoyl-tripeptide--D-alanyl-D-alanine ligase [Novosphingobium sp.]
MSAAMRILDWPREHAQVAALALWDAASAARAMAGRASSEFQIAGVEIDSRDVQSGDLFFALKGESMDGHRFIDDAFALGAVAAVVDRPIPFPHILVEDTNAALAKLAAAARARSTAQIIGVTGSVGKTGVKEAIFAALDRSSRGRAHRSLKSYNNHVGVPLSLARMPASADFGIFELGMNHAGEIAALTRQVRPHVALVTAIAPAHIEMLGSEAAIADAKGEIFEGLEQSGTAIIPADSVHFERLRAKALRHASEVVSFGRAAHATVRLLDAVPAGGGGSLVTADMADRRICYTVSAPGDHWVLNSLAVMAAVRAVGGDLGAAGLALAEMDGLPGRGARSTISVSGGTALLIDESYNANPASMRATLAQLGATPANRRIVVLGAMKELGTHAPGFHAALARPVVEARIDFALLVGEEMGALAAALDADELGKSVQAALGKHLRFAHCADVHEAREALREFGLERGDVVLVKGSNSVGLSALVAELVKPGEAAAPCST